MGHAERYGFYPAEKKIGHFHRQVLRQCVSNYFQISLPEERFYFTYYITLNTYYEAVLNGYIIALLYATYGLLYSKNVYNVYSDF